MKLMCDLPVEREELNAQGGRVGNFFALQKG